MEMTLAIQLQNQKKNGVFLQEFIPQKSIVSSSKNYILEECWLEKRWNYKNKSLDIRKLKNYRLVLKVNKEDENIFITRSAL